MQAIKEAAAGRTTVIQKRVEKTLSRLGGKRRNA